MFHKLLTLAVVFTFISEYVHSVRHHLRHHHVQTKYGEIIGKQQSVHVDGEPQSVQSFFGIPFAVAPERFSAPEAPSPWQQALNASEFGPSCFHQDDTTFSGFPGAEMWNAPNRKSEDCLTLNIWTPDHHEEDRLAVMVWIYGGSYFSGTSALRVYDGRYLAAAGHVIVVSFNYRLGPLGFLPPLGKSAPGNVGMLDQQWALKWVQENIRDFGGDSNNVTLFGESTGAASISLHTLAPSSSGLFNRVILQSGNALTPWAAVSLDTALERTKLLASRLFCETTDFEIMLECLRSKDVDDLFSASWFTSQMFDFPFAPVYGTDFLPEDPKEMVKKSKHGEIGILVGFNSNEGSYFNFHSVPGYNISTDSLITELQYNKGIEKCGLRTNELGKASVAFMYMDWEHPSNLAQFRDALNDIIDHFHFRCPTIRLSKLHSQIGKNVFMYHLSYRLSTNPWPQWADVMHGYEIELVFGLPMMGGVPFVSIYNDDDREVSHRMVHYWTNFAKFGDPNGPAGHASPDGHLHRHAEPDGHLHRHAEPDGHQHQIIWPVFHEIDQGYLEITKNGDIMRSPAPQAFYCAFWEKYLPALEFATSEIDTVKAKWRIEFQKWLNSMDTWTHAFQHFSDDGSHYYH
ncbi:cholinesterase-like [Clavelina lepadiformis]|uniref:cholinesterase-like n=1 Tax=Clavelina lepadiformis TaxID=159417 RepID=UPI004040F171